jgi:hypothetical protein
MDGVFSQWMESSHNGWSLLTMDGVFSQWMESSHTGWSLLTLDGVFSHWMLHDQRGALQSHPVQQLLIKAAIKKKKPSPCVLSSAYFITS